MCLFNDLFSDRIITARTREGCFSVVGAIFLCDAAQHSTAQRNAAPHDENTEKESRGKKTERAIHESLAVFPVGATRRDQNPNNKPIVLNREDTTVSVLFVRIV